MSLSAILDTVLGIAPAQAQPLSTAMESGAVTDITRQFFPALIGGIILAAVFQLVLTMLSAAAGVSPARSIQPRRRADLEGLDPAMIQPIRMFNASFGAWTLTGTAVCVFSAALLAALIGMPGQPVQSVVLGLAIWGGYSMLELFRPGKSHSLMGALLAIVMSNLRSVHENTLAAFSEPQERKIIDNAEKMAADVRERIQGDVDVRDQLQQYIANLEPRLDPKQIGQEIPELFSEVETEAIMEYGAPMDRDAVVASLHTRDGFSKEQAEALADAVEKSFSLIKQDVLSQNDNDDSTRIADEAAKMAGMMSRDARDFRKKIEHYLKTARKTDLDPNHIRQDFERFLSEPKTNLRLMKARSDQLDKSTVSAVLSQRRDLSEAETRRLIEQVTRVVQQLQSKTRSELHSARISALTKLRDYLNGLGRHELRYEGMMHDLRDIFGAFDKNPDTVMHRLKAIDEGTITSMVRARQDIMRDDADEIIRRITDVRDDVMSTAAVMKEEISRRIEESRHHMALRSEYLRRTNIAVTWWTFGTVAVSGVAAVLGALAGTAIAG